VQAAGSAPSATDRALELAFEVTSVVPLAGFALLHVATYGRALFGATDIGARAPISAWIFALEAFGLWLPLGFHTLFGYFVWRRRRQSESAPTDGRAWLALHRLTGAVLVLFLADHFVRFRLPILTGDRYPAESVVALARELSTTIAGFPLLAAWHALGTLALSFHLGYGLMRIADRRARPELKRRMRLVCAGVGVVTAIFGTLTVVRLAAG
jgi:succinate dehydrogenase/fumarate reductase cytochrome b subunit